VGSSGGAAVSGGETAGRRVVSVPAHYARLWRRGSDAGEGGAPGQEVRRNHGGDGAPEVGDDPDRWAPPVGECVREGEGRWAGRCGWAGKVGWAAGRRKKGSGPDGEGVWFCFLFFSNPFIQLFKTFLNQTLLHLFHNFFS
jgi:hypothetical protein